METLKTWFTFKGRISRKTFAIRYILSFLLGIVLSLLLLERLSKDVIINTDFNTNMLIILPTFACFIILVILMWATVNKRFHDIGKSSKWTWGMIFSGAFVSKIPVIGPIVSIGFFLYLLCKKGTDGDNEYGSDPLQKLEPQQLVETNTDIRSLNKDDNSKTSLKHQHQHVVLTIKDLPKLKNMVDSGIITQEEFDSAKKKILG